MVTPPPGTGVGPGAVERAVNALLGWRAAKKKSEKAQLLEQDEYVYVVVSLKKIPEKGVSRVKPYKVDLPHPLVNTQDGSSELCLIIDDRSKSGLTKEDAKKKIDNDGIPISKIIKLSKLKTDYKAFEAKRKLCDSYDMFLADRRVIPLLPKMLGKEFFRKKKIPVSVNLKHKNWKEQIDSACGSALVFVGTGTCAVVKAARLSMEKDEISENVMATINGVVEKVVPKKWGGVRSLHLKLLDSLALPLYETVPELKLKIVSQKAAVEEEKEEKEDLKENVEKKKKEKGRISEVRYMDSNCDAADSEEVEKDVALVNDGDDEKEEMGSAEVVAKMEFTLNPGPFNIKEHVLITIFANCGAGTVYATHILSAVKLYYKRQMTFIPALLVMITTQVLGFGWAGLFRRYLVEAEEMWWPSILVQVSLFRALHEKVKRPKGGVSRTQFFLIILVCSFCYYILPGYLFTMLTTFSWVCWMFPHSVLGHQLGSGMSGLGIGSFGLDWSTIASYLGSPLASPWFATANIAVGFFLVMYVMTPLTYWSNTYKAKTFPLYSSKLFLSNGSRYDILSIVDSKFHLDREVYSQFGPVNLSTFFAMTYGIGFATLAATIVHVLLFNGRDLWKQSKRAFSEKRGMDIHTRLMRRYKQVPSWWFVVILVANIALIIFACEYYNATLQLKWWGVLLACALAIFFTLPIGIINATTNQQPGLNVITEYIIGYLYPERPVANICFKVYGYISMAQALTFVGDFKLGHYMKIPPRSMFTVQVVGTVLSVIVYLVTAWWMMGSIPNLCDQEKLPSDSPWTCPMDTVFFDASVIWGLVGPRRIFGDLGEYGNVNWFFLGGAVAPFLVWLAHKAFPSQGHWIRYINMPVLLGATSMMPPASAVNFTSWIAVGFLSGFVVFRWRPKWWNRYNYVMSGGLDAGTAFMTILIFFCLQNRNVGIDWWGTRPDGCPLAHCPTAPGVAIDGCPIA